MATQRDRLKLVDIYERKHMIAALCEAGFPLTSISRIFDISRERVRQIRKREDRRKRELRVVRRELVCGIGESDREYVVFYKGKDAWFCPDLISACGLLSKRLAAVMAEANPDSGETQ